jgi:hypothetical protein
MAEPGIDKLTRQLASLIDKERREAIVHSLLTALCTPGFVILACLAAAARVLHHLAADQAKPLSRNTVESHVTTLLSRLKLIRTTQDQLSLTLKSQRFIQGGPRE